VVSEVDGMALRYAPIPTAVLGSGTVLTASESFAAALGVPLESVLGSRPAELPLRLRVVDLDNLPRGGATELVDLPGGSARLHARGLPGLDGHLVVQLEELSGRERELRETVRQLRDLVDNCGAFMVIKDWDGRILMANQHLADFLGMRVDEIVGNTDYDMFPAESCDVYARHDQQVLRSGTAMEVEEPFPVDPNDASLGESLLLSLKFPLLDERGRPYAMGMISTDITARKRAEEQARQARDEAQRANQAKSEFLSRMSHELRTPLNSIIGFTQLLRLERLEPDASAHVEQVLDAARHLLALVNDVLELSWVDAGAPGLAMSPTPAAGPLQEALELVRPLAAERDIELASDLHTALRHHVLADPQRLKQVLLNLLSNAIKYNRPAGAVRVHCQVDGETLRYLVTDTGDGIGERDVPRLFAPFVRLDPGRAEGSGLGLALSRRLTEEMGGQVGVLHTAPGEGSTFFVALPLAEAPESPVEPPVTEPRQWLLERAPHSGSAIVLCIDDTPANLTLVGEILNRIGGITLITATSGEQGLELAARHRPDLVLLDLHLADIVGEEVLRRLHADECTAGIPVIVVSADVTPARIRGLRGAGVAGFLSKPLDVLGFVSEVRKVLRAS
jgi:PAS domain S-box-containing protein